MHGGLPHLLDDLFRPASERHRLSRNPRPHDPPPPALIFGGLPPAGRIPGAFTPTLDALHMRGGARASRGASHSPHLPYSTLFGRQSLVQLDIANIGCSMLQSTSSDWNLGT